MRRIIILPLLALSLAHGAATAAGVSGVAVVDPDGTLVRGTNAVSAHKITTGAYEVIMNSDVHKCAFIGTTGGSGQSGLPPAGLITVAGRIDNNDGVYIETFNGTGNSANRGFYLNVRC